VESLRSGLVRGGPAVELLVKAGERRQEEAAFRFERGALDEGAERLRRHARVGQVPERGFDRGDEVGPRGEIAEHARLRKARESRGEDRELAEGRERRLAGARRPGGKGFERRERKPAVGGRETVLLAPLDVPAAKMHAEEVRGDDDRNGAQGVVVLERRDFSEEHRFERREGPEEEAMRARISPGGHDDASLR